MRKKKFTIPTLVFVMASLCFCDINSVDQTPDLEAYNFVNELKKKHDDNRKLKVPSVPSIQYKIIKKIADIISPYYNNKKSPSAKETEYAIELLSNIINQKIELKVEKNSKQGILADLDLEKELQNISGNKYFKISDFRDDIKAFDLIRKLKEATDPGNITEEVQKRMFERIKPAIDPYFLPGYKIPSKKDTDKPEVLLEAIGKSSSLKHLQNEILKRYKENNINSMAKDLVQDWSDGASIRSAFETSNHLLQLKKHVEKKITKGDYDYVDYTKLQSFVENLIANSQRLPEKTFEEFVEIIALARYQVSPAVAATRFATTFGLMSGSAKPELVMDPFKAGIDDAFNKVKLHVDNKSLLSTKQEAIDTLDKFTDSKDQKTMHPSETDNGKKALKKFVDIMKTLRDMHDEAYIKMHEGKYNKKTDGKVEDEYYIGKYELKCKEHQPHTKEKK